MLQKCPQNGSLFWAPVLVPRMGTAPTTGDKVTPILGTRFGTQNEDPKNAKTETPTFCYEASRGRGPEVRNAMCRAPDFLLQGNAHTRSADGQSNEHVRQKVRADATSHRVALLDQLPSWHDNDLEIPLPTELQEAAVGWLFRFRETLALRRCCHVACATWARNDMR